VLIDGATAEGGGDFTVVSLFEFDVLLDVDSVTIACASAWDEVITKKIETSIFFIFSSLSVTTSLYLGKPVVMLKNLIYNCSYVLLY